ncbi:MAG: hypothetical protein WKF77_04910 [Planctomycetaceae bacterium]
MVPIEQFLVRWALCMTMFSISFFGLVAMLLTISTTHEPATDLGYLLH